MLGISYLFNALVSNPRPARRDSIATKLRHTFTEELYLSLILL